MHENKKTMTLNYFIEKNKRRKIKHVSELPNWFKIEKYKNAKELDAVGWYEQLSSRKEAKAIVEFRHDWLIESPTDKQFYEETHNIGDALNLIRENPIIDITSNELLTQFFYFGALRELKPKQLQFSLGVRAITVEDLIRIENSIDKNNLELYRLCSNSSYYFFHPMRNQLNEPVIKVAKKFSSIADYVAFINWNLPDELIIEHFKQYLKNSRPIINKIHTKRYRKPDFKSWHRLGILPYFDLITWGIENDIHIPNRVMADALFKYGEGGEETIRKTTIPLADMLEEDDELLEILAFQASLQVAKQIKTKHEEKY